MKITLKNISEKSGVSIATVSRILSRDNLKHTANELNVINIAKELGYPYIRNISNNKKTINIALILRIEIGEFYPSLFNGFINSSINTNYQFSLVSLKKPDNNIDELIDNINQYDGACIFLTNLKEEDYHKIKETIINLANEYCCYDYSILYEFEGDKQIKRSHCIISIIFRENEKNKMDLFLQFIKKVKNLNTEVIYNSKNKILYSSSYFKKNKSN